MSTYYEIWQIEKGYTPIPSIGEIPDEQLEDSAFEILERLSEFIEESNDNNPIQDKEDRYN